MALQGTDLFAVNRSGTTYQAAASVVKAGILNSHVIQSATPPTLTTHPEIVKGTIWVDTSKSPPELNAWDPTSNGGAGGWEAVAAPGPKASITTPTITAPAAGASNLGESPAFSGSAFSGTGTTHISSDWQVTLATDTGFASPVAQSTADTTNKEHWGGATLTANTDYLVRVRYNGTGVSSAWSAAVAFKTKASFIVATAPGSVYKLASAAGALTALTSPVKLVNLATTATDGVYGIGVDGKIYNAKAAAFTLQTDFTPLAGKTAVDMFVQYGGVNWGAERGFVVLYSDGSIQSGAKVEYSGPSIKRLIKLGGQTQVVLAVDQNAAVWGITFNPGLPSRIGTYSFTADRKWENTGLRLPVGVRLDAAAGAAGTGVADSPALVLLGSDGKLYSSCDASAAAVFTTLGFSTSGTNASPVEETTYNTGRTFDRLGPLGSPYDVYSGVAAITSTQELWLAGGANLNCYKAAGTPSPFAKALNSVNTLPVSCYRANYFYVVDGTGVAVSASGSLTMSPINMGGATPAGPWTSVGTLPGSHNQPFGDLYLIIPS